MVGKSKILEEIHPLHLIREVKKWPALYHKDSVERTNGHFRAKVWREVAKVLFKDWHQYSEQEKELKALDLSRKWRNLRDTFRRQVERNKKTTRDGRPMNRKEYVYYRYMRFLLPHCQASETEQPSPPAPPAPPAPLTPFEQGLAVDPDPLSSAPPPPAERDYERIDEDKHFLLSLVPSFKRMTDCEKLTAKVEILKVIQSVRSGVAGYAFASSPPPLVKRETLDMKVAALRGPGASSASDDDE